MPLCSPPGLEDLDWALRRSVPVYAPGHLLEQSVDGREVRRPFGLAPAAHPRELRCAPRCICRGVLENSCAPGRAVQRIEVLRRVAADFAQRGKIAADHGHTR